MAHDDRRKDAGDTDLESPLGLTGEPIKRDATDHFESGDPTTRRRRARALGEDGVERESSGMGDLNADADGAAGTDMGYGGEGTDVKRGR